MSNCQICGKHYWLINGSEEFCTGRNLKVCNDCGKYLKDIYNNPNNVESFNSLISKSKNPEITDIINKYQAEMAQKFSFEGAAQNNAKDNSTNYYVNDKMEKEQVGEVENSNNSEEQEGFISRIVRVVKGYSKYQIATVVLSITSCILLICVLSLSSRNTELYNGYVSLNDEYKTTYDKEETLSSKVTELTSENTKLTNENDELKNGASTQLVNIKNAFEKQDWQNVIDLSKTLHQKYNGSAEDFEAQKMSQESQNKLNEAAAAKAAQEAKGYDTGITYDQLARTPDSFVGQKVKFTGTVLQVMEGDGTTQIRLAVNDNYDTVVLAEYISSVTSSRVLEDDTITIYGTSSGNITYDSTMGGAITIPGISVEKIDH